ncbi:hypothetical protein R3P38DRAFT_3344910, partial [Favolaschia claudopus]
TLIIISHFNHRFLAFEHFNFGLLHVLQGFYSGWALHDHLSVFGWTHLCCWISVARAPLHITTSLFSFLVAVLPSNIVFVLSLPRRRCSRPQGFKAPRHVKTTGFQDLKFPQDTLASPQISSSRPSRLEFKTS